MDILDATDIRLLNALQKDASLPRKQLAALAHISEATCSRRLAALEKHGYITGIRATLNAQKLGFGLTVFVLVAMESEHSGNLKKFEAKLKKSPLIRHISFISGEYDYLLHVVARDMEEYSAFAETTLVEENDVRRYNSMFEFKCLHDTAVLPLS
ncbi:MAG: Lrp/AsnC family transcriptional regulator [Rickettsiales bacterium]|nr:Lrp/AsnC family transcriptional regulator [Rickettsiales bacterium]